ncbi:MAG: chemotaxis protein CheR [Spirochaetaceae bacterium]|nr:MAG: chemotaxis protein CheR [Spirochaetaceae bacterium]
MTMDWNTKEQVVSENGFPIVGIGASAGGLAAFESFFSGMPADSDPGMAFVLVQHLAPDHKSVLSELIGRYTRMQVFEVEDGMTVHPNCAYIIPPGFDMAFLNGSLQLLEPVAPRGRRLPIDFLFRSLAQDQRHRSIGIVLSGTASDGTLGIRAIKGEGGMVMAQSPDSTEFDGMPRSAIATGLVDYVLPPQEMPAALIEYAARAFGNAPSSDAVATPGMENHLKKVFVLLRGQSGHDFSLYKPNSVIRRIERRMAINQIDSMDGYVKYLQNKDEEVQALFRDLLIGVTQFFRDDEAFTALEQTVVPRLLAEKPDQGVVRVWSLGCSTGEEAYSLAILLHEAVERLDQRVMLQVFATDIDPQAIAVARAGTYPPSIAADMTTERLARYFTAEPDGTQSTPQGYRINKNVRDTLIFSEQNVIKDPPLSKMDLIVCRNLLIYLSGDLQKKLIPLFHYALNPGGFLFLGSSESVGEFGNLFSALDRKAKIFQRAEAHHRGTRMALGSFLPPMVSDLPAPAGKKSAVRKVSFREIAEQTLLKQLAPASALIDRHGDILYLHGRTGLYLEPSPGEAGPNNLFKMARQGLQPELKIAVHKAISSNEPVSVRGLSVKTNDHFSPVDVTVCPVDGQSSRESSSPLFLVVLEEGRPNAPDHHGPVSDDVTDESHVANDTLVASLRSELKAKDEYLRTAHEELEASNADLMSSVEEMQSMNEEMQSSNEELETSKEELQSVNEELATVNVELQTKVTDLSRANNDMNNLLAGTGIATVFLDHQLRILRFTPTASALINLIPSDVGRPVGHILSNLVGYDHMIEDVQAVLNTLIPTSAEVQTRSGDWFTMRILPYRTTDNVIEGAVVNFVDITDRRAAEQEIKKQLADKELLLQEIHHRIKNNIASIRGLLSTQAESVTNPEATSILQDAIARVNSLSVLYENLLIRSEYEASSAKCYVERLIDSVVAVFPADKQITVKKQVADFSLNPTRLFPVGIIINELLTNIMKYAFAGREAGLITISLRTAHDRATLTVQDDGNGLPEHYNIGTAKGFGHALVSMLTEQLGGHFSIESDDGTTSVLEFPI